MKKSKYIEDFKNFLNQLFEDLNFSYPIEWEMDKTDHIGYFLDNEIMFQFSDIGNNCWFYKFFRLDPELDAYTSELNISDLYEFSKKTNILGTIRQSIIDFIDKYEPNAICFSSMDNSRGRKNIYELFCSDIKIKKGYGYAVFNDNKNSYKHLFILYKDVEYIKHVKNYFIKKYKIIFGR